MGVKFLDYLFPAMARPYPADSQTNDLGHWDIAMVVEDAATTAERLQQAWIPFISSGLVELPDTSLGFRRGFLVRDPDGHAVRVIEQ